MLKSLHFSTTSADEEMDNADIVLQQRVARKYHKLVVGSLQLDGLPKCRIELEWVERELERPAAAFGQLMQLSPSRNRAINHHQAVRPRRRQPSLGRNRPDEGWTSGRGPVGGRPSAPVGPEGIFPPRRAEAESSVDYYYTVRC